MDKRRWIYGELAKIDERLAWEKRHQVGVGWIRRCVAIVAARPARLRAWGLQFLPKDDF
jgi:hypothetical protein